ncbi:hypothetical protein NDU88_004077 [Pleurodeles waltl]|uniref:Uncharacterized protein n=1 Tax=Pleurodeles waltl TaxID=8319 RepID=A0AAV7RJ96_PLEWA|nr:hypothetical protein NDU88_004077 [Pleurodeles waltl]
MPTAEGGHVDPVSPASEQLTLHGIMTAVQGTYLETKTDSITTEVMLARANLRNLGDHKKEVEDSTVALKGEKMALKT